MVADTWHRDTRATPTRPARSRSMTAHGYAERFNPVEEEPEPEPARITIPKFSSQRSRSPGPEQSPGGYALRPSVSRTSTYENSNGYREDSPAGRRMTRVPTDSSVISSGRSNLRPVQRQASASQANTFADDYEDDYAPSNSNGYRRSDRDRSPPSPDTSSSVGSARGSVVSRAASWTVADQGVNGGKKAPPPPPPSRAKKPPPPPPPMKRSALSESQVARY
jgi:hypothetical protein